MTLSKPRVRELTVTNLAESASICLTTDDDGHSTLASHGLRCEPSEPNAAEYNAGIDGMEHQLLALWPLGSR